MTQQAERKKLQEQAQAKEREEKKQREAEKAKERAEKAVAEADIIPPPEEPATWHTLGSMNPDDNYSLVVTLTSQGAGIERIELVDQMKTVIFDIDRWPIEVAILVISPVKQLKKVFAFAASRPAHPLRPPSTKPIRLPSV